MPYCVGTKNGFVVTWLTNTIFQRLCAGNGPAFRRLRRRDHSAHSTHQRQCCAEDPRPAAIRGACLALRPCLPSLAPSQSPVSQLLNISLVVTAQAGKAPARQAPEPGTTPFEMPTCTRVRMTTLGKCYITHFWY